MRLFNDVQKVGVQADDIKRMFRLGRRCERDRPLLIEFRNRQIKNLVMECLGSLQDALNNLEVCVTRHDSSRKTTVQRMCSGSIRACQTGRFAGIEVCGKWKPWSNASDKAEKDILANDFEIK